MKRISIVAVLCMFLAMISGCGGRADSVDFPLKPNKDIYVIDNAGMVSQETKDKLLQYGKTLDDKYGAQVVVVTIPTLNGMNIDEYANNLFRTWGGVGSREKNNGVLVLISKEDRKFRIEVGYGLEGKLTDSYCNRVLSDMRYKFKHKHYSEGIELAYVDIVRNIYEEYGDTSFANEHPEKQKLGMDFWEITLIIVLVICFGSMGAVSSVSSNCCGYDSSDSFGGGSSGGGGASGSW